MRAVQKPLFINWRASGSSISPRFFTDWWTALQWHSLLTGARNYDRCAEVCENEHFVTFFGWCKYVLPKAFFQMYVTTFSQSKWRAMLSVTRIVCERVCYRQGTENTTLGGVTLSGRTRHRCEPGEPFCAISGSRVDVTIRSYYANEALQTKLYL